MASFQHSYLTIEEFIQAAVAFERKSVEFYRTLKDRVEDSAMKDVLEALAQEEQSHEKKLKEFVVPEGSSGFIQYPPDFKAAMPDIPDELPDVEACIALGLERERKSVEIYERAADLVVGDFQQILQGLAGFERQHIEQLMKIQERFE